MTRSESKRDALRAIGLSSPAFCATWSRVLPSARVSNGGRSSKPPGTTNIAVLKVTTRTATAPISPVASTADMPARVVALKLLRGGLDHDTARFEREVTALANVAHPAVVRCLDRPCSSSRSSWSCSPWA